MTVAGLPAVHERLQTRHHKVEERPNTLGHMLPPLIQRMDFLAIMTSLRQHLHQAPPRQIFINMKIRQASNPDTGDSHTSNRLAIVGLQVALDNPVNNATTQ